MDKVAVDVISSPRLVSGRRACGQGFEEFSLDIRDKCSNSSMVDKESARITLVRITVNRSLLSLLAITTYRLNIRI